MEQAPWCTLTKIVLLRKAFLRQGFHLSCPPQTHCINNAYMITAWIGQCFTYEDASPGRHCCFTCSHALLIFEKVITVLFLIATWSLQRLTSHAGAIKPSKPWKTSWGLSIPLVCAAAHWWVFFCCYLQITCRSWKGMFIRYEPIGF